MKKGLRAAQIAGRGRIRRSCRNDRNPARVEGIDEARPDRRDQVARLDQADCIDGQLRAFPKRRTDRAQAISYPRRQIGVHGLYTGECIGPSRADRVSAPAGRYQPVPPRQQRDRGIPRI
jgi:hypothetical protein